MNFDDLDGLDDRVTLISFGSAEWPRWMIYHRRQGVWWGQGAWRGNQRDGEMWDNFEKAADELRQAEQHQFGLEEE
jgi:hypothetical protein